MKVPKGPNEPSGSCGGESIFCTESGMCYEALGPGHTRHYHNALVTGSKMLVQYWKVENVLCILRELPDKRMQVDIYEFENGKSQRNPDRFTRQILSKSIECAEKGMQKLDLSMLRYKACAREHIRRMVKDFPKVTLVDNVGNSVRFPMELNEVGLPVDYCGARLYVNGEGFSIQPNDSIVMYEAHKNRPDSVVRYEYTREKIHIAIYKLILGKGYKKTWARHWTFEEARKAGEEWIQRYFEGVAYDLYRSREFI